MSGTVEARNFEFGTQIDCDGLLRTDETVQN